MVKVSGIILSGGRSSRFEEGDKALYPVGGKPMIRRVYEALSDVADEVIVAVDSVGRAERYSGVLGDVRFVLDKAGVNGPVRGVCSALEEAEGSRVIILPNDTPFIEPRLLDILLKASEGFHLASPIHPNGFVESAVMVLDRLMGRECLRMASGLGRRPRMTDLHRGLPRVRLINTRAWRLSPRTLLNVNRLRDLEAGVRDVEGPLEGDVEIVREMVGGGLETLRASLWQTVRGGDPWPEARLYLEKGAYMLAAHAFMDSGSRELRWLGESLLRILATGDEEI